jgi:hypothetical protein
MTDRQSEFDEIEIDEGEKIIPGIAADGDAAGSDQIEGNAAAEAVAHSGSIEAD